MLAANLDLPRHGLVTFTWGNVSGIDRERNLVVIKPSGVSYERMRVEDMVVLDLAGKQVEGTFALLRHRHPPGALSRLSGAWRRGAHPLHPCHRLGPGGASHPIFGTTQADYFHGEIPAPACSPRAKWRRITRG